MIRFLLGPGLFSGALAVSFREGIPGDLLGTATLVGMAYGRGFLSLPLYLGGAKKWWYPWDGGPRAAV